MLCMKGIIYMNYLKRFFIILCGLLAIDSQAADKLKVLVSILPQQYFAQEIGGEYVETHVLVGLNQSPETYEPSPQQMIAVHHAELYFSIGVPFESVWLDKIKDHNQALKIIACCDDLADLADHDDGDDQTIFDPHVWTNPVKAIQISHLIARSLMAADPKNRLVYQTRAMDLISKLEALDVYIKEKLADFKGKQFIVEHPAWDYFATQYGLEQIAIERHGKEIQPYSMLELVQFARQKNIKAVFVQPYANPRVARIFAKEIGATMFELDPLAFHYIENMKAVTDQIVKGLSQ